MQSNLPKPVLHHQIRDDDGELLGELDLGWPGPKVNIEIDGEVHNDPVVRSKDDAHDVMLRRLGWTVRRVYKDIPVSQPVRFLNIVRTEARGAHRSTRFCRRRVTKTVSERRRNAGVWVVPASASRRP